MADQIADLQLQVAQLTQMLRSGVKMETVSGADRQSVKDALEGLDGGEIFNEAVAVHVPTGKTTAVGGPKGGATAEERSS